MKVTSETLASAAYGRLAGLIDEGLGNLNPAIDVIEEAQFCIDIMRQISQRKKRFVIDVVWPK